MEQLQQVTATMARTGIRRLLVLAGEARWSSQQVATLAGLLPGDWLWVGAAPELPLNCAPPAMRTLLGREFTHAVFDARGGLDAEAFAVLSGTLKAGSWLVLLAPDWSRWPQLPDADSCRWSDSARPIATPNFISHLQRCLLADSESCLWQQHQPLRLPAFTLRAAWHQANGAPEQEQADILRTLQAMPPGVAVVTAPRGRGKSALAGMLLKSLPGKTLVTAPARAATDVLALHAGEKFTFIAPDALLSQPQAKEGEWLIIDEAAALPAPQLRQLIARFPRTLLTTTVQGYEGTGRGFLLKFCAGIDSLTRYVLSSPIRWAQHDPLESIVGSILLFGEADITQVAQGKVTIGAPGPGEHQQLKPMYQLLSGAHYRTSPLDWRRMLDAPGQHFIAANCGDEIVGAAWLVEEGGLDEKLSCAVWAGFRRPRGNLVAQSLAAHGGSPLAATLRGLRVTRIAVHPLRQRRQLGQQMMVQAEHHARQGFDYLSVSFGFTDELWQFWQRCGFTLVRVGSHREASSGCYAAMALLPLSEAGKALCRHEQQRLERDFAYLRPWIAQSLPIISRPASTLNGDDWLELAGFAYAHRPLEACLGALNRLLEGCDLPMKALRGRLQDRMPVEVLCAHLRLAGRKALLGAMRQEVQEAIEKLDMSQSAALKNAILQWPFSTK